MAQQLLIDLFEYTVKVSSQTRLAKIDMIHEARTLTKLW